MLQLTPAQRAHLRSLAHPLHPVVLIGDAGLSEAVLREIDCALTAHELIKIKARGSDKATREEMLETLCARTGAAPVQQIGGMLVVYRPAAEPRLVLP